MGLIAKVKSLVLTKKCPVLIVHSAKEIEWKEGIINEENHLKDGWDDVGWEKHARPIIMRRDGAVNVGYIVHPAGATCDLKEITEKRPRGSTIDLSENVIVHPWLIDKNGYCTDEIDVTKTVEVSFQGAIGKATSADIIEKGLDLVGSNRKILIGIAIGILVTVGLINPILSAMLS